MQQMLPMQTSLYRYNEGIVQIINDKDLNGSKFGPLT